MMVEKTRPLNVLQEVLDTTLREIAIDETIDHVKLTAKSTKERERIRKEGEEMILDSFRLASPKALKESRRVTRGFEGRNFTRWKPAFDHLEMMWSVARELGEMHGIEVRDEGGDQNNSVMNALSHLFPRALLVTQEIISLLKCGFPDGALVRWRALHEITVAAMYIAKNGEHAAKCYLLSFHFAARRAAHQINKYSSGANIEKVSDAELSELDRRCAAAEGDLGRSIGNGDDGEWPRITQTHKTFAALESDVRMDHWRPRYKWASVHTHANYRPAEKLLGMKDAVEKMNLVGQSNSGLVDPFQMTAISLAQATATYLLLTPNLDRIAHSNVLLKLSEEMFTIAMEAERRTSEAFLHTTDAANRLQH